MIKIYPSRMEGEPLEVHETQSKLTLRLWLEANAPDVTADELPITININGKPAGVDDGFCPEDEVQIWVEPRGVGAIVGAIVAAVVAVAVAVATRPKVPKQSEQRQGKPLQSGSLSGNQAVYGDPIPEIAGRPARIYPNYLLPTRQYFTGPRTQWVEALLCVGKGKFEKSLADVYVGDTRALALGSDVVVNFYEPGQDLSGDSAAIWWHTPKEVGFTSRGHAGMELGTVRGRTSSMGGASFRVERDILTVLGNSNFPSDWGVGVALRIDVPYQFTIHRGSPRDILSSKDGLKHLNPEAGMQVEMSGDLSGIYTIASYIPASGGSAAQPGSPSSVAGDKQPDIDGYDQDALIINSSVERVEVEFDGDYEDREELLAHINESLAGLPFIASYGEERELVVAELPPFSGDPLLVGGTASIKLFGETPTLVEGEATLPEIPAATDSITLNDSSGRAVSGLEVGAAELAIGTPGMGFDIVAAPNAKSRVVVMKDRSSWAGWAANSSDSIRVGLTAESASIGWTGPFSVTPPNEQCTEIEVDYAFPNGLIHYNKKGRMQTISATVYLQWRVDGGPWQSRQWTHRAADPDAMGYTRRIVVAGGAAAKRVEVRMRRSPKLGWTNTSEDLQWLGLRSRMVGAPTSYPGVTTMSVKLRTGDKMSAQVDNKVWIQATRILKGLDGVERPTRDIAPFVLHMFRECGYDERTIDLEAFEELHEIWSGREDRFDLAVDKHSTVKRLANDALRAGFAELTIDRGLLTPVRDARKDIVNYVYSPQELLQPPTVATRMVELDEIDGVDVEYVDEHTGKTETIQYRLPGDEGRRAEKIQLVGVTNWTRAWRLAARQRRIHAYRRTTFKGTTELHALNSSYMSKDRFQEGIPGYGQSAFVVERSGNTLRLSEPMDWGTDANRPGAGRVIAMRRQDGRATAPVWVRRGKDDYEVVLTAASPIPIHLGSAQDPTMVYFGMVGRWSRDVLIQKITPHQNNTVDVEAVEYDDRVYADDDRDPKNEVYLTTEVYAPENQTTEVYAPIDATSMLYPIEFDDSMGVAAAKPAVRHLIVPWQVDQMQVAIAAPAITRRTTVRYLSYNNAEPDALAVELVAPAITRTTSVRYLSYNNAEPEALSVELAVPAITRRKVADYLDYEIPPETLAVALVAPDIKRRKI